MTMLAASSLDHFGSDETLFFESQVPPGSGGLLELTTTNARHATGRCLVLQMQSAGGTLAIYAQKDVPAAPTTIVCGFAFWPATATTSRTFFRLMGDDGAVHLSLLLNNPGDTVRISNAGGTLETSTATLTRDDWNYIEIKAKIDDSTGTYDVRLNGDSILSGTSIDTRNGGTAAVVTHVQYYMSSGNGSGNIWRFDDLYILDDQGTKNNDFLGSVRIYPVYPTAEGNYSAWTPSTGIDNSALVDETDPNGDTDYISSSTATNKDSYTHGGIGATSGAVHAVTVNAVGRRDSGGSRAVKSLVRLSSTDANGASKTLLDSYRNHQGIHETKPGGGDWTISDVNNCEFGIEDDG